MRNGAGPAAHAHHSGQWGIWVTHEETVGSFVVDERVICQPLDGTALGAGVVEVVPGWH